MKYNWNLPILVNDKLEVVVGNCLKDSLNDEVLIIMIDKNDLLEENLFYMESKIVEENSEKRINVIYCEIREYLREYRKPKVENISLFEEPKNTNLITEENYIIRKDQFKSHGYKKNEEDYQLRLIEFEDEVIKSVSNSRAEFFDFEVDYEILKELL